MRFRVVLYYLLVFTFLFSCSRGQHSKLNAYSKTSRKKVGTKDQQKKLAVKQNPDRFQLVDLFRSEQKQNEVRCPSKSKRKENEYGKVDYPKDKIEGEPGDDQASIIRKSRVIEFDIVHVEERKLDIPAFKQFKNNMTDFTRDGEQQFKEIILQIKEYLGDNTDGTGVTLFITGSASQIPTSFDPTKPHNNVNPDGTSVKGETSIENNRLLALARATELAKKIEHVFKNISIVTPKLSEIELGRTQWTHKVQQQLDKAYLAGDQGKMMEIFEPFQKDQFVKVESNETFVKTVQPNSIKMYTLSFVPRLVINGEEIEGSLVVSQQTFWDIGPNRRFESASERAAYLKELGLDVVDTEIGNERRWYVVGLKEEKTALKTKGDYEKLLALYALNMVNEKDRDVLETIITTKYLNENKYKYILKTDAVSHTD